MAFRDAAAPQISWLGWASDAVEASESAGVAGDPVITRQTSKAHGPSRKHYASAARMCARVGVSVSVDD